MKWPIEPIYEVTKKLEKSWFLLWILTVSLIFVEFLGCQKMAKKLCYSTLLQNGRCKTPPTLFPKIQEKKNSAWLYVLSFDFSQEKYLYVVKGAEIMQIGDAHWKSTCWVDFRKRVEKSVVADGFKKLFESWILKANNPSLG